jgi:hypothetical protein
LIAASSFVASFTYVGSMDEGTGKGFPPLQQTQSAILELAMGKWKGEATRFGIFMAGLSGFG